MGEMGRALVLILLSKVPFNVVVEKVSLQNLLQVLYKLFAPSLCHLESNFSLMDMNTQKPSLQLLQLLLQLQLLPHIHWKAVPLPQDLLDSKLAIINLQTIVKSIVIFKHWMGGKPRSPMFGNKD